MRKILLIYASSSGNTEQIATLLNEHLDPLLFAITQIEIGYDDIDMHCLLQYDGILFGTYSYDDGDVPYEVESFHEDLVDINLTGKVVGVFGSGDKSYPSFCGAVVLMKEQFEKAKATVIEHIVKVDGYPEDNDLPSIEQLASQFKDGLA